jgi:hypothetical protein
MSEAAHVLERGVRDDLVSAVKGVARAVDRALRSVARGIEGVVERIEAVEAHLAGQLARIGDRRIRAALLSAWSPNLTTNGLATSADCPDFAESPDPDYVEPPDPQGTAPDPDGAAPDRDYVEPPDPDGAAHDPRGAAPTPTRQTKAATPNA